MTRAWHLASRPDGLPKPADFELKEIEQPALAEGMIRVRNLWLSVDPYMRGRMNDVKSYVPPFALGAPMEGGAIGEVIESRAEGFAEGDKVQHMLGWRNEAVLPAAAALRLPDIGVPDQAFLGALGMPGMTAWFGLLDVAGAKAGDTVFVSAAAGAVGSTVIQIAKARGMTAIGSAGGAEKCAWVASLGADAAIDYKAEGPLARKLGEAAPDGIDVYFDNVGGEHLDAAFAAAKPMARFAICGMIEGYNAAEPMCFRYIMAIIARRLTLRGFIVTDFMGRMSEFYEDMAPLVKSGALTARETVCDGLETQVEAFLGLFSGENVGKMLVRV